MHRQRPDAAPPVAQPTQTPFPHNSNPAFILAVNGKALCIAACLAGFATFACVIFRVQVYAEVAAKSAS